jgi:hypothetical protein
MARDGRFYEARYPEVDDVVMVQARVPPAGVRSSEPPPHATPIPARDAGVHKRSC